MVGRFIFDSRDDAADERLEILNDRKGVWRCCILNCTKARPREIRITKPSARMRIRRWKIAMSDFPDSAAGLRVEPRDLGVRYAPTVIPDL